MKLIIVLFILILAIALGISFYQNKKIPFISLRPQEQKELTIKNQAFKVDVANTFEEKKIGLSSKISLPQDSGMIFPFEKSGDYPFWMKDMKFSLDIIFINQNHIVTIYGNVQPPRSDEGNPPIYRPESPADAVLEINAGLSQKYGFQKGDEVKIK